MNPSTASLVLLSCGTGAQIAALQAAAAAPLALALQLSLHHGLAAGPGSDHGGAAQQALAALPAASLAVLPLDPGLPLGAGQGHWAAQLGAARQPCLLLLSAEQAASGVPAAATALLLQWRVPLLGVAQWGGQWDAVARRHDGLPWLGWLDDGAGVDAQPVAEPADGTEALVLSTRLRWRQLLAELSRAELS
ncbi:MAG: hypothetical protein VKM92_04840 [Cyanobacteriota bacterium]|nr:hypothetical protein [Cyanobacteriota bacterium]